MLSDVLTEKTQFDWMHEVLWELIRSHPSEDELVMQYAVMGLCKSGAVVGLDQANGERLSKIVEVTLKVKNHQLKTRQVNRERLCKMLKARRKGVV